MVAQLRQADALNRLPEVYEELPRTRRELGYPPLVTPTSQIVGTQAVLNVLFGRYKMISNEIKDYVYGLYGKPPAADRPRGAERWRWPATRAAASRSRAAPPTCWRRSWRRRRRTRRGSRATSATSSATPSTRRPGCAS